MGRTVFPGRFFVYGGLPGDYQFIAMDGDRPVATRSVQLTGLVIEPTSLDFGEVEVGNRNRFAEVGDRVLSGSFSAVCKLYIYTPGPEHWTHGWAFVSGVYTWVGPTTSISGSFEVYRNRKP